MYFVWWELGFLIHFAEVILWWVSVFGPITLVVSRIIFAKVFHPSLISLVSIKYRIMVY